GHRAGHADAPALRRVQPPRRWLQWLLQYRALRTLPADAPEPARRAASHRTGALPASRELDAGDGAAGYDVRHDRRGRGRRDFAVVSRAVDGAATVRVSAGAE